MLFHEFQVLQKAISYVQNMETICKTYFNPTTKTCLYIDISSHSFICVPRKTSQIEKIYFIGVSSPFSVYYYIFADLQIDDANFKIIDMT